MYGDSFVSLGFVSDYSHRSNANSNTTPADLSILESGSFSGERPATRSQEELKCVGKQPVLYIWGNESLQKEQSKSEREEMESVCLCLMCPKQNEIVSSLQLSAISALCLINI